MTLPVHDLRGSALRHSGSGGSGREPARGALASRARLRAAVWAGRLAAASSRVAGRGSGVSIRGRVILGLDPDAPRKLLRNTRVALVSGTNGKTTTSHLLAAALRASSASGDQQIVHNSDGANLLPGIVSALSAKPTAELAILETDERVVVDMIRLGRPEVLVLLNLTRDQLDRNHEIKAVARSWRAALQLAGGDGPLVVANASDPLVVWAAEASERVLWVDTGSRWTEDSSTCPRCGSSVVRERVPAGDATRWRCGRCSFAQPKGELTVRGDTILENGPQTWQPELAVPGSFNVQNAACALAAARVLGAPVPSALRGMRTVKAPAGRFSTVTIGATTARLLLAKNPAGWAEALELVEAATVIVAIDSAAADGRDVSWLWDVDFERLAGRTVVATGTRAQDLGVRLSHAGVQHSIEPDVARALMHHPVPVDVCATYTPFQLLRKWGRA